MASAGTGFQPCNHRLGHSDGRGASSYVMPLASRRARSLTAMSRLRTFLAWRSVVCAHPTFFGVSTDRLADCECRYVSVSVPYIPAQSARSVPTDFNTSQRWVAWRNWFFRRSCYSVGTGHVWLSGTLLQRSDDPCVLERLHSCPRQLEDVAVDFIVVLAEFRARILSQVAFDASHLLAPPQRPRWDPSHLLKSWPAAR